MRCKKRALKMKMLARFLLMTVTIMYLMNNVYIGDAKAFPTRSSNSSSEIWEWVLLRNKSDFPTTDTPVLMTFGDYVVPGETGNREGSRSSGFYVSLINGESEEYTVLEPVGDQDRFITRGMLPSFWMGKWDDGNGGRYYFKPTDDKGRYIEHIDKNTFESGCDNWWYETLDGCHSDENTYDADDVYWMFRVREYGDGQFGFYAPNTGNEFYLCSNFCGDNRFGIGYRSDNDDHNKIRLYKGTKVDNTTILTTKGETEYTIKSGEVMTVKDITYLPRGNTVKIEDGAILIVSGRFICNGIIANNGTLIVDDGGFLFPLDSLYYDGKLICEKGDVIVRNKGVIALRAISMNYGNLINYGVVNSISANFWHPLMDNKSGAKMFFGLNPNRSYVRTGSNYNDSDGNFRNSVENRLSIGYYDTTIYASGVNVNGKYRVINNGDIISIRKTTIPTYLQNIESISVEGNSVRKLMHPYGSNFVSA